jgi:hypothetical protein
VLGLYEDRIRQRVEWVEHGVFEAEHRYFFVQHLVVSILKTVPKIYDWYVGSALLEEQLLTRTARLLMPMSMENISRLY